MSANVTPLFPQGARGQDMQERPGLDLDRIRPNCLACGTGLTQSRLYRRLRVCPKCQFHYSISARRRIATLADEGTFKETSRWIQSLDPLEFSPRISYRVRLLQDQTRTGLTEAAVTGVCAIGGTQSVIIVLDFGFLGGSMGLVVGEKVALALELAARKKLPAVAVVTSGGARIQEGVLSLMQMAKTVVALNSLHSKGMPLLAVLGNPCTGQAMGSFASLSDVIFAEPGAHVGFAPFRSAQDAERHSHLQGRFTAESYQSQGHIDRVVDRRRLKHEVASVLDLITPEFKLAASRHMRPMETHLTQREPWEMVQIARRPDRPKARDYIERVFANFIELHGDRLQGDDPSIVIGLARLAGESVMVIGQQKTAVRPSRPSGNGAQRTDAEGSDAPGGSSADGPVGYISAKGFRKATRAIKLAERFTLPVITIVDTPGPTPGVESERQGIANAIATTIDAMSGVEVPTISVLIGEGGSEAALALGVADVVMMQQNAIYTPIEPEQGAETELSDAEGAAELAKALKLTSTDCLSMGIVDVIIPEPAGGARNSPDEAARLLKRSLMRSLIDLRDMHRRTLVRRRQKKYRNIGEYGSRFRSALRQELRVWRAALSAGVKALRSEDGSTRKAAEDG